MVQFRKSASVNEVTWHLTFISFGEEIGVKRSWDLGKRAPHGFQAHAVIREGLEARGRLELQIPIGNGVVEDDYTDQLVLIEAQRFNRAQDAAFINSLQLSHHVLYFSGW